MSTRKHKEINLPLIDHQNDIDEDEFIDIMGFGSFGKIRNRTTSYNKLINKTKTNFNVPTTIPKPEPPPLPKEDSSESDVDTDSDEKEIYESITPEDRIPSANILKFMNGSKLVSTISIETSGSRMIIGGRDFHFNMYDFAAMDSQFKPFRSFDPLENVPIRGIKHSPANDLIMVYGGSSLIKLVDRDGKLVSDCMRGDQYLVDMNQTRGHVSAVNSASWNPVDLDSFVSAGMDATIRTWSVEAVDVGCFRVIPIKNRNRNNPCVDITFNHSGTLIYASCEDGSLNIWDPKRPSNLPSHTVLNAHTPNSPAYSLAIARNDFHLASRGFDDTLKLWDVRNFKNPIKSITVLNSFDTTRVIFSPDYKLIITAQSERDGNNSLNFYRSDDLTLTNSFPFNDSCPVVPVWHPKLEQLFVGCSDGSINVYFDPKRSMKGILLCMNKVHQKKDDIGEIMLTEQVFTPYSREDGIEMTNANVRKMQMKARKDPFTTRRPEPPVYGPGQNGRVTTSMSLSAFVCQQMIPMMVSPIDETNPREAILKYAELAEEEPYYVAPAYEKTQPVPLFQEPEPEDDTDDIIKKKKTQ